MEENLQQKEVHETVKSTNRVEVVPVQLEKHPNADTLSVAHIYGYTCVVRTDDWKGITAAAYIPPDNTVDVNRPEFKFLAKDAKSNGRARIKAKKLRGIISFGLLIPAPTNAKIGDDVTEFLGVEHYELPLPGETNTRKSLYMGGEAAKSPNVFTVKYDVDALRRYHQLFTPNESVVVTEKLDGANSRYVFMDGEMHCGSRTEWKKEYPSYDHVTLEYLLEREVPEDRAKEILERLHSKPKQRNLWWEILDSLPALRMFCETNPGLVVYGEAYGSVGRIKYGIPNTFAAFDIMRNGMWLNKLDTFELLLGAGVPIVPSLGVQAYDFDKLCAQAEGQTLVHGAPVGTIREGIVVTPINERRDPSVGRIQFKLVSATYLEKF